MEMKKVVTIVLNEYAVKYNNFTEFSTDEAYKPLWDLCVKTLRNEEYLKNIKFCNDYYNIPPVRVFMDINREEIDALAEVDEETLFHKVDGRYLMKNFVKQSLGAFWGMVFRYGLNYGERRSVTMIKDRYYGISTASRFLDEHD